MIYERFSVSKEDRGVSRSLDSLESFSVERVENLSEAVATSDRLPDRAVEIEDASLGGLDRQESALIEGFGAVGRADLGVSGADAVREAEDRLPSQFSHVVVDNISTAAVDGVGGSPEDLPVVVEHSGVVGSRFV